ncbi:MAG: beta-galactosidase, partial [Lachnospiraceae bacterium]|nr:beta-galactosidase [Lachnospiraceae bacterium]
NMSHYLRPQECGSKMGVRYAELLDADGFGFRFETGGLMFSALPYSPEQLEGAEHPNELPPVLSTYVRIGKQMGVGGDDTWGALVHPEYHLNNGEPMSISFSFRGINRGWI